MQKIERDHVIRVILEGRDFLSSTLNKAVTNYNRQITNFKNSNQALNKALNDSGKELDAFIRKFEKFRTGLVTPTRQGRAAFAKFFGIDENDVDDFARSLERLDKMLTGVVSTTRQGRVAVAKYLGVSDEDVDAVERNVDRLRQIMQGDLEGARRTLSRRLRREGIPIKTEVQRVAQGPLDAIFKGDDAIPRREARVLTDIFKQLSVDVNTLATDYDRVFEKVRTTNREVSDDFELFERKITAAIGNVRETLEDSFVEALQARDISAAKSILVDINDQIVRLRRATGGRGTVLGEFNDEIIKLKAARPDVIGDINSIEDRFRKLTLTLENLNEEFRETNLGVEQVGLRRGGAGGGSRRIFAAPPVPEDIDVNRAFARAIPSAEFITRLGEQAKFSELIDFLDRFEDQARISISRVQEQMDSLRVSRLSQAFVVVRERAGAFFKGLDRDGVGTLRRLQFELIRAEAQVELLTTRLERARASGAGDQQVREIEFDLRGAKRDVEEFDASVNRLDNTFYKVGRGIRRFIDSSRQLVNIRWLVLAAGLHIYVAAIIALGAALTEVASSAALAAAALGGTLVTGLLAAAGAVGILRAALGRVSEVFGLVEQAEEQELQTSREASDQAEIQSQAQDRLTDALQDQRDAAQDLARARREAARDIVRAAEDERLANLSLREAELGVTEAKRELLRLERDQLDRSGMEEDLRLRVQEAEGRLRLARQLGQEAEVASASQQVDIARNNLAEFMRENREALDRIEDQKTAVQRAQINVQQQRIRTRREVRESRQVRAAGIEGNEGVIAAQRRLRDATEAVTEAKQELTQTTVKETAAQEKLKDELSNLSGAERRLFNTLKAVRARFREVFRPITDIIVSAVDRAVQRTATLLEDNRIIGAARGLSTAIASAFDRLSTFSVSREGRNAIVFFLREAQAAMPFVARGLENIAKIFVRIGRAAAPLFRELLVRITNFSDSLEKGTRNQARLERFFFSAARHLRAWIELGKAIGRVLFQLGRAAAPSGRTIVDDVTESLNRLAKFLEENQKGASAFFERMRISLTKLASLLLPFGRGLIETFTSPEAEAFTRLIIQVLIPAFQDAIFFLGLMSEAILAITKIPFAKELIGFLFALGILRRIFPFLRNLDAAFLKLVGVISKAGSSLAQTFIRKGAPALARFGNQILTVTGIGTKRFQKFAQDTVKSLDRVINRIHAATIAQTRFNISVLANPYVAAAIAIAALITALILLEVKFGLVSGAIDKLEGAARGVASFFTTHWKTVVLAAILAPFSPFLAGGVLAIRFRNGIKNAAQAVINFFRTDWQTIATLLANPFSALTLLGQRLGQAFIRSLDDIVNGFRSLPGRIIGFITGSFARFVADARDFGRDLIRGIIDGITSMDLGGLLLDAISGAWNFVKGALGIHSASTFTREQIGRPLGEGIVEGTAQGMTGLRTTIVSNLNQAISGAEATMRGAASRIRGSLGNLEFLVSQQIGTRLEAQTPSERALQAHQEAETRRQRQQGIDDANNTVKQAQREFDKSSKERERAERRLTNATTKEQKDRARSELTSAKEAQKFAKQALDEAIKQRAETLRQAAFDEKTERLSKQAEIEREALEKSVAAEQQRATRMFEALRDALDKKDWSKVQRIFNRIVDLTGINDLGSAAAQTFVAGLVNELRRQQGNINKAVTASQTKARAVLTKEQIAQKAVTEFRGRNKGPDDPLVPGGAGGLGGLRYLIRSRNLDLEIALDIVRMLSVRDAQRVLTETLQNEGGLKRSDFPTLFKGKKGPKDKIAAYLRRFKDRRALEAFAEALEELQIFATGGEVRGSTGKAVPAIVHAGEWVLNKGQQMKLSEKVGEPVKKIQNFLFGPRQEVSTEFAQGGVVRLPGGAAYSAYVAHEIIRQVKDERLAPVTANRMLKEVGMPQAFSRGRGPNARFFPQNPVEEISDFKWGQILSIILSPKPRGFLKTLDKAAGLALGVKPTSLFSFIKDPIATLRALNQQVSQNRGAPETDPKSLLYLVPAASNLQGPRGFTFKSLENNPKLQKRMADKLAAEAQRYLKTIDEYSIEGYDPHFSQRLLADIFREGRPRITAPTGTGLVNIREDAAGLQSASEKIMTKAIKEGIDAPLTAGLKKIVDHLRGRRFEEAQTWIETALKGIARGGHEGVTIESDVFRNLSNLNTTLKQFVKAQPSRGPMTLDKLVRSASQLQQTTLSREFQQEIVKHIQRGELRVAEEKLADHAKALRGIRKDAPDIVPTAVREINDLIRQLRSFLRDHPNISEKTPAALLGREKNLLRDVFRILRERNAPTDIRKVLINVEPDLQYPELYGFIHRDIQKLLETPKFREVLKGEPRRILKKLLAELRKEAGELGFQGGGSVPGKAGQAVPAIVHAGEWILNKVQQTKLAKRLGTTREKVSSFLFGEEPQTGAAVGAAAGAREGTIPRSRQPGNVYGSGGRSPVTSAKKQEIMRMKPRSRPHYNLVKQIDDYGMPAYFVEQDDGAFGSISVGSALKIIRTKGQWFPQSLLKSIHGFAKPLLKMRHGFDLIRSPKSKKLKDKLREAAEAQRRYDVGGIVQSVTNKPLINYAIKSYAAGGIVTGTPPGVPGHQETKTFHQNFNVTTQSETDWNYVLRLAAIHAAS